MPQQQAPTMVGPYEQIRQIDKGGMAVVYLARQENLDREVALKVLDALPDDDPELAARFVNEARVASSLSHPNIVTTHDYFVHEGRAYIAMEFVAHGSLRPHMQRLSLPQTAGVLECVLAALRHAHAHGIVHRDIKPENVLVAEKGVVKLADFGIAKALNSVAQKSYRTATGATWGTPAYMAPEQALSGEVSSRSDLYSVGVMAYEMVTHQMPYGRGDRETPMRILLGHIQGDAAPPVSLVPSLDPRLGKWIESMMAREPERRPADPDEAWHALEDIIVDLEEPMWRRRAAIDVEAAAPSNASTHVSRYVSVGEDAAPPEEQLSGPVRRVPAPQLSGQIATPGFNMPPNGNASPPSADSPVDAAPSPNGNGHGAAQPAVVPDPAPPAPPESQPPREKRRRGGKLTLAGGLAVLALGAGGGAYVALGSTPEPVLPARPVEAKIGALVKQQTAVDRVDCPSDVPDRPGIRYACTIELAKTDQRWLAIVTHRAAGRDDIRIRLR